MRSTFAGFEIAKSGIYTAQSGINLTGNNIANAETPGYTRQRLDVAAVAPYGTLVRLPNVEQGIYGNGVTTLQVSQIRDAFIDREYRTQYSEVNYWSTRLDSMSYLESKFDPTDNEISKRLQEFYTAISDLSKYPEKDGVRPPVKVAIDNLCTILNTYSTEINSKIKNEDEMIAANVSEINSLAQQIANLNKQIYAFELSGQPANDLRDSLNYNLDQLSGYVDITYSTDSSGRLSVFVGGETLVSHTEYNQLETRVENGKNEVYWKGSNKQPTLTSGELKGHIDMRDGDTDDIKGLPYFLNELDSFVAKLVNEVNEQHRKGYTNTDPPVNGIDLFDPAGITAGTIKLNDLVAKDPNYLAAASANNGVANNENALELSRLLEGNFESMLNAFMSGIGTETSVIHGRAKTTLTLAQNIEQMRMSISSVSLDEEMTNLIKYQHSYSAAARALTTMDEALDILINRTGRVGL